MTEMSKVGVYLDSLDRPLKKALEFIARTGVRAVELNARGDLNPRTLSESGVRHFARSWMITTSSCARCVFGLVEAIRSWTIWTLVSTPPNR